MQNMYPRDERSVGGRGTYRSRFEEWLRRFGRAGIGLAESFFMHPRMSRIAQKALRPLRRGC